MLKIICMVISNPQDCSDQRKLQGTCEKGSNLLAGTLLPGKAVRLTAPLAAVDNRAVGVVDRALRSVARQRLRKVALGSRAVGTVTL